MTVYKLSEKPSCIIIKEIFINGKYQTILGVNYTNGYILLFQSNEHSRFNCIFLGCLDDMDKNIYKQLIKIIPELKGVKSAYFSPLIENTEINIEDFAYLIPAKEYIIRDWVILLGVWRNEVVLIQRCDTPEEIDYDIVKLFNYDSIERETWERITKIKFPKPASLSEMSTEDEEDREYEYIPINISSSYYYTTPSDSTAYGYSNSF